MDQGNGSLDRAYGDPVVSTGVIGPVETGVLEAQQIASADLTVPTPLPEGGPSRQSSFRLFKFNGLAFVIATAAIVLVVLIGAGSLLLTGGFHPKTSNQNNGTQNSNYSVGNLPLQNVQASGPLQVAQASQLAINGQLQVNDTLVLTPGALPSGPVTGEVYYDKSTNQPYYYNGSAFISLAPTTMPQHVSSIGGLSGAISVGGGLQVTSGQLVLDSTVLQSLNSPSGVLSLAAGTTNVVVDSDGNGNYTISDNSVVNSGSTGAIALITGSQTIGGSVLSQSGTALTAAGSLTVTGAISTNSLQQTAAGNDVSVSAGNDNLIFTAGGRTFEFPTTGPGSQVICTTGISCASGGGQAVLLQPGSAQLDNGTGSSIFVNNSGSGDLIELQGAGSDRFVVTHDGNASVSGSLTLGNPLTVANGGTGHANYTTGDLLYASGAAALAGLHDVASGDCLVSGGVSIAPLWQSCPGASGVATVNGINGAVNLEDSNGQLTFTTTGQNLDIHLPQNLSATSTPAFTGLTLGVAGTTTGSLNLANSANGNLGTLKVASLGQSTTYTLPDPGAGTATICLNTGNCAGSGGGVTTAGGTQNYLSKFSNLAGTQIGNSLLYDNGSGISLGGTSPASLLNVGASNQFQVSSGGAIAAATGITSSGTITFSGLNSTGVVHTSVSGQLSTGLVVLGGDTSGSYVANLGTLTGLSASGNSGAGSTPGLSVLYGATSNTAVMGNTTLTCASGTGNLSGGGNIITLGSGGSCGGLTIVNSPTFSGALTVQGSGGVTIGVAGTTTGSLNLASSANSNLGTLQIASLGQGTTYTLPDPGGSTATICLTTGNCAGSGGGLTGSGTSGNIAKFNGTGSLTSSSLSESGSTLTYSGNVVIQGSSSLSLGTASSLAGSVSFANAAGSHTVTLQAPTTDPASNLVFHLPNSYGSNGSCLISDSAGGLSFQSCTGGVGGGVTSVDNQSGVVTINNSSGNSGAITINNASTSQLGIAQFNATNFIDNGSGTINTIQDIAASAAPAFNGLAVGSGGLTVSGTSSFSGSLAATSSAGLTVGVAGTTTGSLNLANAANSNIGTLQVASLGQSTTYTLPDPGASSATICLSTGNCAGAGGGITGSGTSGQVALFNSTNTLTGSSVLTQSGSAITNSGTLLVETTGGSTTALQVSTATNVPVLTVDTTNQSTYVGNTTPIATLPSAPSSANLTAGADPFSNATANLCNNGLSDLAVANFNTTTISIYCNTGSSGTAAFSATATTSLTTGTNPNFIATGNFCNNGRNDIAVSNYAGATVYIYCNTGSTGAAAFSATFTKSLNTATHPQQLAAGNFCNNGKTDIALANTGSGSNNGHLYVYCNTGSTGAAAFSSTTTIDSPDNDSFITGITTGNLCNNSLTDIAIANNGGTGSILIYCNTGSTGSSSFSSGSNSNTLSLTLSPATYMATGNICNNGHTDLVATSNTSTAISAYCNTGLTGASSFSASPTFTRTVGTTPLGIAVGNVCGNGRADVAESNNGSGNMMLFCNTGSTNSNSLPSTPSLTSTATSSSPAQVAVGNLCNNSKIDIAVAGGSASATMALLCTNGGGPTTSALQITSKGAATPTLTLQGVLSQAADILDIYSSTGALMDNVNSSGDLCILMTTCSTTAALQVTGNTLLGTSTNSSSAFQVQNSGGLNLFAVDTSGNIVNVGSTGSSALASTTNIGTSSSSSNAQAVNIGSSSDTSNTVSIEGGTGASAIQIGNGATAHGIQIGTGAAVQSVSVGSTNSSSSLALAAGTGGLTVQTQGTGTLGIGNNAVAQTIAVGNATGATSLTLKAGTGGLSLQTQGTGTLAVGNNAVAQTLAIGNTTGATSVSIQAGTGGLTVQTQGTGTLGIGNNAVAQILAIGNSTGTTSLSLQGGTGGINLGTTGIANTIQIGNTSGAVTQTINLGNNNTASSQTNVTIGSQIGASTTTIQAGTGNIVLQASGSSNTGVLLEGANNSTAAFQIQNSTGVTLLNDDTTTGNLTVNQGNLTVGTSLTRPAQPTLTSASTGGTLTASQYWYVFAYTTAAGTSPAIFASPNLVTDSGSTNVNTLTWSSVSGATGYTIYRSKNGTSWFSNTVGSGVTSLVDNGSNYTWASSATPVDVNSVNGYISAYSGYQINNVNILNVASLLGSPINAFVGAGAGGTDSYGYNSALGYQALQNEGELSQKNSAIGYQALNAETSGAYNTALGAFAGYNGGTGQLITASNDTFIGANSSFGWSATQPSASTSLGYDSTVNQSNAVTLGCTNTINGCNATSTVGIGSAGFAPNSLTVSASTYGTYGTAGTATTISQTTTTITGSGTTFTAAMTGGTIYYNDGSSATVTYVSATSLTSSSSKTVTAGSNYTIVYGGFNVTTTGSAFLQPSSSTATAFDVLNTSNSALFDVNTSSSCVVINGTACNNGEALAVNGTVIASGTITASGSPDIAEYIPVDNNVSAYDVVSAGPDGNVDAVQSSSAYDPTTIGVISDGTSSFIANGEGKQPGEMPIVLAGRVPVHVTNMNGPIEPGDYLTTSSIPGYAMLATGPGPTIGKALAAFNGSTGTVMVQVNLGYYAGNSSNSYIQNGGNATLTGLEVGGTADFSDLNISGMATINDLSVQTLAVAGNIDVGGSLTVSGLTSVQDLQISGHIITAGGEPMANIQSSAGTGAAVSITGDDTTGTITVTTGSNPGVGTLSDILFSKSYGAAPHVVISPSNAAAANSGYFKGATTSTDFMLNTTTTPAPNTTYQYDYFIAQ